MLTRFGHLENEIVSRIYKNKVDAVGVRWAPCKMGVCTVLGVYALRKWRLESERIKCKDTASGDFSAMTTSLGGLQGTDVRIDR